LSATAYTDVRLERPRECQGDPARCRISVKRGVELPVKEWHPVFDGLGNLLVGDPNVYFNELACSVCNQSWRRVLDPPEPFRQVPQLPRRADV